MSIWKKRWAFADKWYCEDYVVSKIAEDRWHLEQVGVNGHTIKHIGTYSTSEAAMSVGECLIKNKSQKVF